MKKNQSTKPHSPEERKTIIELWQESGKNKSDFCKEFGINYQTFIGWTCLKKWRSEHVEGKKPKGENVQSSFVPLAVMAASPGIFAEVQLEHGTKIYLHREVPASFLRSLLG